MRFSTPELEKLMTRTLHDDDEEYLAALGIDYDGVGEVAGNFAMTTVGELGMPMNSTEAHRVGPQFCTIFMIAFVLGARSALEVSGQAVLQ